MELPATQLEFETLISEVPDSSNQAKQAKRERARALAKQRHEKETEEIQQRLELAGLLALRGDYEFSSCEFTKSISSYLEALQLNPTLTHVRGNLVVAYTQLNEHEVAKDLLIDALRDNPEELWAYIGLARHYSSIESNIEMAQQLLTRALELDPDDVQAHKNLGSLHFVENRLDEALAHFDRVISHQPENAHAHYGRVMAYLVKDLLSKAELALKLFVKQADTTALKDAELLKEARESMTQRKGIV